jgi:hypothetical protein
MVVPHAVRDHVLADLPVGLAGADALAGERGVEEVTLVRRHRLPDRLVTPPCQVVDEVVDHLVRERTERAPVLGVERVLRGDRHEVMVAPAGGGGKTRAGHVA